MEKVQKAIIVSLECRATTEGRAAQAVPLAHRGLIAQGKKTGTSPKCVFCATRSYGYRAEYKSAADRRCDTDRGDGC